MKLEEQTYDPVAYKAEMVVGFSGVAEGYSAHAAVTERIWGPIGERLLDLAGARAGGRVLDIATGGGGLAVAAARRVGSGGHVLGTDASRQMIEAARSEAEREGLAIANFRVVDADSPDLPEASFDAAVCRYALNFFFDLGAALDGVLRSLVPGGKLAACTVGPPEELPFATLIMGAILEALEVPPPPEPPVGAPHFFSLSDPGLLEDALTRAGFAEVQTERLEYGGTFESGAELAEWTVAINPFFKALLDSKPERREAGLAAIERTAEERYGDADGRVTFPAEENISLTVSVPVRSRQFSKLMSVLRDPEKSLRARRPLSQSAHGDHARADRPRDLLRPQRVAPSTTARRTARGAQPEAPARPARDRFGREQKSQRIRSSQSVCAPVVVFSDARHAPPSDSNGEPHRSCPESKGGALGSSAETTPSWPIGSSRCRGGRDRSSPRAVVVRAPAETHAGDVGALGGPGPQGLRLAPDLRVLPNLTVAHHADDMHHATERRGRLLVDPVLVAVEPLQELHALSREVGEVVQ